jgi:hypothetical protein
MRLIKAQEDVVATMGSSAKLSEERGEKSPTTLLSSVLVIKVMVCS